MGIRGELFSTRVILQNRTYFFNVKENRLGDLYLNIVESKNKESGGFERQSVVLFADDLQDFLKGFDESLRVMEKAVREQKRGKSPVRGRDAKPPNGEGPEGAGERRGGTAAGRGGFSGRTGRQDRRSGPGTGSGQRSGPGRETGKRSGSGTEPERRFIVRKSGPPRGKRP
jgi:hypothetical protein